VKGCRNGLSSPAGRGGVVSTATRAVGVALGASWGNTPLRLGTTSPDGQDATGTVTVNVEPRPKADSKSMEPPAAGCVRARRASVRGARSGLVRSLTVQPHDHATDGQPKAAAATRLRVARAQLLKGLRERGSESRSAAGARCVP
jgi:hypothetical protein